MNPKQRIILRRLPVAIGSLFLSGCIGCSSANKEANKTADNPATRAARLEAEFQNQNDTNGEIRSAARQSVFEFVRTNLPTWSVKGMSDQQYSQNLFATDADLEKDGRHVVVAFFTEKFFPESGDPYWLAIPINKFTRDRLHRLSDDDLLKQFNGARRALDNLQPSGDDQ